MREMSLQRRRVVVLASSVAAMSGLGSLLFRRHAWLGWTWVGLEVALLVWVIVLMVRLRDDEGACVGGGAVKSGIGIGFSRAYSPEDKAATARYGRWLGLPLLLLFGLSQLRHSHLAEPLGLTLAGLEGLSFAAILMLAWAIALRSGDEYRRLLLRRSLALGTGMTVVALSVCGFLEFQMHRSLQIPLGLIPVGLAILTVVAKLIVFRRARG